MIDSVGSSTSAAPRAQAQVAAARPHPVTINAVAQTQQKKSAATNPVTALAVPQGTKSGNSSNTRLPRGSIVDQLA